MKTSVKLIPVLLVAFMLALSGCSNKDSSSKESGYRSYDKANMDSKSESSSRLSNESDKQADKAKGKQEAQNKMVIYEASLSLRVKKFEKTMQILEEKATNYGGYIAESSVTNEGKDLLSGTIKIRIPEKHFQTFLHDAEGEAAEVIQRDITGTDVTEEYIDLSSRLKSKRVVEERLLSFMKNATKTEDLLKISNDLASVQEEIETIEGRMKYLENQTSFSTVTITLYEKKVVVPDIDKDQLNTWDRTKQQFMESTNFLLQALSGLFVFFVGNLPVLLIIAAVCFIIFFLIKKRIKGNGRES